MFHACFECHKSFESEGALSAHKRFICEAKTRCDKCGELCSSTLSCSNHMKFCQPQKSQGNKPQWFWGILREDILENNPYMFS